jgi:tryptophan halogenase
VVAIGLSAGFIEPLESNGLFTVHEFLLRLIRTLNREQISQWDKDNYTYQCKKLFRDFAEFVALHYALSQRTDTEYWKTNFNKEWCEDLINLKKTLVNGFVNVAIDKDQNFHYPHNGGFHCIAAGMNWPPTDIQTLQWYNQKSKNELLESYETIIKRLDMRKEHWNNIVKYWPNLHDFLKTNIYNNVS